MPGGTIWSIRSRDSIAERDIKAGKQVVQVRHGARPDDGAGHAGVRDGKAQCKVGHRQPGFPGQVDELFDDIEPPLIVEVPEQAGAAQLVLLALADASREQSLGQWPPHQCAHPVPLDAGRTSASMLRLSSE